MRISDWSSDVCSSDLKYLALGHRSLYMSGNRTKESIIGFLKKVNRDACGRAGRPQFHAFARAGPRSAARLRTPPLALGGRSGAYQRTQPAEREPLPPYAGQARLCAPGRRALSADPETGKPA